jgi:Zn-dependent protease
MTLPELVIYLAILLFSVIFHEVAHGLMADRLGDPTARHAGRLTLNPIPHIDLMWSIILPALLILSGSPVVFGAAKPVPVDFRNLRNLKRDMFLVAIVGPLTNVVLAVLAALTYQAVPHLSDTAAAVLLQTVILNLVLAIFNLIPIPPLDGSKVLASILGFFNREFMHVFLEFEKYGFILLIIILFSGLLDKILFPPVNFLFNFLIKF